jgi:hypothetical protein
VPRFSLPVTSSRSRAPGSCLPPGWVALLAALVLALLPAPGLHARAPDGGPRADTGASTSSGGVEGRVRDADGRPLRGVAVLVTSPDARPDEEVRLGAATTDETGYFRIQPLPAGVVELRFLASVRSPWSSAPRFRQRVGCASR